jgi:hypothetical protein
MHVYLLHTTYLLLDFESLVISQDNESGRRDSWFILNVTDDEINLTQKLANVAEFYVVSTRLDGVAV